MELKRRKPGKWALLFGLLFLLVLFFFADVEERSAISVEVPGGEGITEEITEGNRIVQSLPLQVQSSALGQEAPGGRPDIISVRFFTFQRSNSSTLTVRLLEDGRELERWETDSRRLEDGAFYPFLVRNDWEVQAGKAYQLEFSSDAKPGQGVAVWVNQSAGAGGLVEGRPDGMEDAASLCFRLTFREMRWGWWGWAGLFYIACSGIFLAAASGMLLNPGRKADGIEKGCRLEHQFLIFWVGFSLFFGCCNTLFNVPDEIAHFYRAFEVSQGHVSSILDESAFIVGRELPIGGDLNVLRESWPSFWENRGFRESTEPVFRSFFNTALYAPVSYLPQAAGIAAARLVTDRLALIAYAGRFSNWMFITALLWGAVRILPRGKRFAVLFLLMPMNLQEAFSLAPDGMTTALAVFMTALVMALREIWATGGGEKTGDRANVAGRKGILAVLYSLAIIISLHKIVYLPLCLMYLLIPDEVFGGRKKKLFHGVCMAVLVSAASLLWLSHCGNFMVKQGTDGALQLQYIISHPVRYLLTMVRSIVWQSGDWIQGMAGRHLAWLNVAVPGGLVLAALGRIFLELVSDGNRGQRAAMERGILIFMLGSIVILICTSLYMQWTPLYSLNVEGIQGRYFLPLLLPLYLLLWPGGNGDVIREKPCTFGDGLLLTAINLAACLELLLSCCGI